MRASVVSCTKNLMRSFLIFALTFGLIPIVAFAEEGDGSPGERRNDELLFSGDVISQEIALEPVARTESTRNYLLANAVEGSHAVSVVNAKLSIGGEPLGDSVVVGSFAQDGMTYAIEPGGESVALVAVDYRKLPEDVIRRQILAIPDAVSPDGIEAYSVTRIAAGALASLTKEGADPAYMGCKVLFSDEELPAEADIEASEAAQHPSDVEERVDIDDGGEVDAVADPLEGCVGILALGIPASISSIEDGAFTGSDTLQYLVVSDDNPTYASFDGALYSADLATLRLIPEGRVGAVRIAPSATEVNPEVFSHCPSVDAVVADADSAAFYSEDGCLYTKDMSKLVWEPSIERKQALDRSDDREIDFYEGDLIRDSLLNDLDSLEGFHFALTSSDADTSSATSYAASALTIKIIGNGGVISEHVNGALIGTYSNYVTSDCTYWVGFGNAAAVHFVDSSGTVHYLGIERAGFTFGSWGERNDQFDGRENYTFNAIWIPNTYTITLDNQGASSAGSESLRFTVASYLSSITPPSRNGYTFEGYYTGTNGTGDLWFTKAGQSVVGICWHPGDITLYAKWIPNIYSISYTLNGGFISGQLTSYTPETANFALAQPARTGYVFAGWDVSGASGSGIEGNGTTNVTVKKGTYGNLTATAKWIPNTYTVSFDPNGGTGGQAGSVTATYDANMPAISTVPPDRLGYTFQGWYDTSASVGGTCYYSASGASARTWNKTSNTTLYARWVPNSYAITWNANGGTVSAGADVTSQTYGTSIKLPADPTRKGYAFAGWWTTKEGAGQRVGAGYDIATVEARAAIYFARWDKVEGKISLKAHGPSDTAHTGAKFTSEQVDAYNAVAGRPKASFRSATEIELAYDIETPSFSMTEEGLLPTLLGSTFRGWEPSVSSFSPGTTASWNASSETFSVATYTATWTTNGYAVSYEDRNGDALVGWSASDGSILPSSFNEASTAEERKLPSMVKRGYTWKGWLYEGSPVTSIPDVSKNITIVADFEADPYTIEVDLTGGSQSGWHEGAFEGLTYDDPILTLPDNDANLKKPGYVFSHFVAHREGSDEEASVFGRDDAGAYTVPTTRLIPGESYQVLNLGSGEDVYDVASIEAVWTVRIAIDVPTRASLGILIDAATDTVRFRANETSYTGDATDVYAELAFTSYTTAPIGIVEVAEDTADPGHADRAALAQEVFGPKMGDVTITLSDEKAPGHALPLGGKTTLSSDESHLAGLVLDAASASPSKKTFYLGMGLSSLRASDVATNRSGDIAKLFYTVALLDGYGDVASDPSRLKGYDGEGVVW